MSPFVQPVGPSNILPPTVLEIFQLFFTSALMATVVEQTNIYAHQVLGDSAEGRWTDVTPEDMWAFLGFVILMGINRLPQINLYWNTSPEFHYRAIAEKITRDRFKGILRFLHFRDNTTLPQSSPQDPHTRDRLWKIRPVIEAIVTACRTNYRPHRELAIDEAMVAFKGRSSLKQYLPMKPVKRGFKIWVCADSHNSYVCEFECYTGRIGERIETGLGGSVVTRLSRDLVGKNYHIYMDNFFSSVTLYRTLLSQHIYCTGTLRANRREFPPALKDAAKRGLGSRGDSVMRQDGNIVVTVWQDKRPVVCISSGHNPAHTTSVRRRKGDGSITNVNCPIVIVDYNRYMGGVDKGDQLRRYYNPRMKSRKSYKYIFWFMFEVCVLNAFILSHYSPCNHPISNYLSYRRQLANELIGTYNSRKRSVLTRTILHTDIVTNAQHYPTKTTKRTCKLHGCTRQTVWYCPTCDLHLCHTGNHTTDCFLTHHARYNLFHT